MREARPSLARIAPALLALLVAGTRLAYLSRTGPIAWEDAFISLRYAENLLRGDGFAYNPGERVLGSTAPLYVLLLAALRSVAGGAFWQWWAVSGIVLDAFTAYVVTSALWASLHLRAAAALFALFFAIVPVFNDVCLSGMETPLVLLLMALLAQAVLAEHPRRAGALAAVLILTRVDGLVFAGLALAALAVRSRRHARPALAVLAAILAPCLLAGLLYFGGVLPNTIAAKRIAYGYPLPFLARQVWKAYVAQTGAFSLLVVPGAWVVARSVPALWFLLAFDVSYAAFLVSSGVVIFPWYLAPGLLAHFVVAAVGAQGLAGLLRPRAARLALLAAVAAAVVHYYRPLAEAAAHWQRELHVYETNVPRRAGEILAAQTPPSSTVLLEPIGYVGYYSGRYVHDAVGLVSPQMMEIRARHRADWLYHMAVAVEPDFIVSREGFREPGLYLTGAQRMELEKRYSVFATLATTHPGLQGMVVWQRRGDLGP